MASVPWCFCGWLGFLRVKSMPSLQESRGCVHFHGAYIMDQTLIPLLQTLEGFPNASASSIELLFRPRTSQNHHREVQDECHSLQRYNIQQSNHTEPIAIKLLFECFLKTIMSSASVFECSNQSYERRTKPLVSCKCQGRFGSAPIGFAGS